MKVGLGIDFPEGKGTVGPLSRFTVTACASVQVAAILPAMNVTNPTGSDRSTPATALPDLTWVGHMAEDGGSTTGSSPSSTLTANDHELSLRGPRGDFHVPRTAVTRISRGKFYPWFFMAVRIHHNLPRCSQELQFKPMDTTVGAIFDRLRALGYPVR
jgi:hypothetical protein